MSHHKVQTSSQFKLTLHENLWCNGVIEIAKREGKKKTFIIPRTPCYKGKETHHEIRERGKRDEDGLWRDKS